MQRLDRVALWQFLSSALLGIVAIGSIWWVLSAPPVHEDQGSRATFAGWVLAFLPLVAAAVTGISGVRRVRARPSTPVLGGEHSHALGEGPVQTFQGGQHTHIYGAPGGGGIDAHRPVTVLFSVGNDEQERLGRWVEDVLATAGYTVRRWSTDGGNSLKECLPPTLEEDLLVLVVVDPDEGAMEKIDGLWKAVLPDGMQARRVVLVNFGAAMARGLLANVAGVRVDQTGEAAAAQLLDGLGGSNSLPLTLSARQRVFFDASTVLPRLQRLSSRARQEAATVGDRTFVAPSRESVEPGLYVRRDLESDIVERLASTHRIVVSGSAGSGKTSLLWGLADRLLAEGATDEVYFVKAPNLIGVAEQAPLVAPTDLITAVAHHASQGRRTTVLLDTADLLVSDDRSLIALDEVIGGVTKAGGRIVITSRPTEAAQLIDAEVAAFTLGSYGLEPACPGDSSEFTRAVAAHAVAYCRDPGDTSELAAQVSGAAIRQLPLGGMARLPLSLRMLFDLYAPGKVPPEIDPTSLFEHYWSDRVLADRRSWARPAGRPDEDLSATTMRIAHEMLKLGRPQVVIDDLPRLNPSDGASLGNDIVGLCNRGVGSMSPGNLFTFFHQTFFEYAAAQDLLRQPGSLDVLVARATRVPDDYFLAPVLEQSWICAWRSPATQSSTRTLTHAHLQPTAPSSLRRVAVRVVAQSAVTPDIHADIVDLLSEADPSLVKEYLALRPRPGRPWTDSDTELLSALRSRTNPIWHACVEVLRRLATSSPEAARQAVVDVEQRTGQPLMTVAERNHPGTKELLANLAAVYPQDVLHTLSTSFALRDMPKEDFLLKVAPILLAMPAKYAETAAQWADEHSSPASSIQVHAHARLHRRAIGSKDGDIDWPQQVNRCRAELGRIAALPHAPSSAPAFVWGLLDALDQWDDDARDGVVLELVLGQTSPRVHAALHHGWLVSPLNRSDTVRRRLADVLVAGLPASHREPADDAARWSDSIRRTIAHTDTSPQARREIVGLVLPRVPASTRNPWLEPDLLMWVLMPAACAGEESAWDALVEAETLDPPLSPWEKRIAFGTYQLLQVEPRTVDVLEYVAEHGRLTIVENLLKRVPDLQWKDTTADVVTRRALADLRSTTPQMRATAARVYQMAVEHGYIGLLEPGDMRDLLTSAPDSGIIDWLGQMAVTGVRQGLYDAETVVALLRDGVRLTGNPAQINSHDARACQRNLVALLASRPGQATVDELVELACLPPADGGIIHNLVAALTPHEDGTSGWSGEEKIELIIRVGTALARPEMGNRARKDVPGRWGTVLFRVLAGVSLAGLRRTAAALPEMDPIFAANIAGRLPVPNDVELRSILTAHLADPDVAEEVKRQIAFAFERGVIRQAQWSSLDDELAATLESKDSARS
jgi:hypothetical protein